MEVSLSNHFKGGMPYKAKYKFDIHVFQGEFNALSLDKWLSLLEGYLSFHNFSNKGNMIFVLLKDVPSSKISGKIIVIKSYKRSLEGLKPYPLRALL